MVGDTLGSYRIVRALSQGAFGQVYEAQHTLLGKQAAVKVLHPDLSRNQDVVARFFNEARAAASIRHPGLVEVFDFGYHHNGAGFLVMELLGGESLAQRLARGPLPEAAAAAIARQVAAATGAAHAAGIVHRDLKPDNLFLVPDRDLPGGVRVKVLDFGIAKLSDAQGMKTSANVVMGTAAYMSPEQCTSAAGVDRRADVYSLGCILFESVCGRPPFLGQALTQLLAAHLYEAPPAPRSLVPALSPRLEGLIMAMLAKDPVARPQAMEDVVQQLEAISRGETGAGAGGAALAVAPVGQGAAVSPLLLPTVAGAAAPLPLAATVAAAPMSRRNTNGLLAGGLGLLLAGGLWAAWPKPPPPPPPVEAKVRLTVMSEPPGASVVRDDGVTVGTTPYTVEDAPGAGQASFKVKKEGYKEATVSLARDKDNQAQVQLVRAPSGGGGTRTVTKVVEVPQQQAAPDPPQVGIPFGIPFIGGWGPRGNSRGGYPNNRGGFQSNRGSFQSHFPIRHR